MKRRLRKAIEELHQRYYTGPIEADCDDDFDFGFTDGMKVAYDNITEDLAALLGQFYSDWKPARMRQRK